MPWDIHNKNSSITQGVPDDISTNIYHLELLNSPDDDPSPLLASIVNIKAEEDQNARLTGNSPVNISEHMNLHDLPKGQKNEDILNIFSSAGEHPIKTVRYAKPIIPYNKIQ